MSLHASWVDWPVYKVEARKNQRESLDKVVALTDVKALAQVKTNRPKCESMSCTEIVTMADMFCTVQALPHRQGRDVSTQLSPCPAPCSYVLLA